MNVWSPGAHKAPGRCCLSGAKPAMWDREKNRVNHFACKDDMSHGMSLY